MAFALACPVLHTLGLDQFNVMEQVGMKLEQWLKQLAVLIPGAFPASVQLLLNAAVPHLASPFFIAAALATVDLAFEAPYCVQHLDKVGIILEQLVGA